MHSIGYLFKEGLKSLWKNRTMSIASVAVLISCLLMRDMDGSTDLFNGLLGDENPLPDAYIISMVDLSLYDQTMEQVRNINGVSKASDFRDIATKLSNLDRLVRYCSIGIVLVLSIVSLFIIANTVKVTMFSRRMEINIMKSVGATNGFVRIPFIVEGIVIGILSGAISATVLYFAYDKAVQVVYGIVPFITAMDIDPYIWLLYVAYIAVGMLFGIMGGVISISKYLKKEGENAIV